MMEMNEEYLEFCRKKFVYRITWLRTQVKQGRTHLKEDLFKNEMELHFLEGHIDEETFMESIRNWKEEESE